MSSSQYKDDFPWLYELGAEAYRKIKLKDPDGHADLHRLMRVMDMLIHHPAARELGYFSKRRRDEMEDAFMFLRHYLERLM